MKVVVCFNIEGLDDISLSDVITDQEITPEANNRFMHVVVENTLRELIYAGSQVTRFKVDTVKLCEIKAPVASSPSSERA